MLYLIEILHQTTTGGIPANRGKALYLIEILHQTTTHYLWDDLLSALYLIEILHQTTTRSALFVRRDCCILSKFYIKPQLRGVFASPT